MSFEEYLKQVLIPKAAKAAIRQNRPLFIYTVAYKGMSIHAVRPPRSQRYIEIQPNGNVFEVIGNESQLAGVCRLA